MARTPGKQRYSLRGFLILVAIVLISGILLWSQGDLTSPLQSTTMLLSLSSSEPGFAMAGESDTQAARVVNTSTESSAGSENAAVVETSSEQNTTATTTTGTMTLETLVTELAAAGVDVESVSATMTAEGRSLDNLLAVVNSGRVTVAELATRLKGESTGSETGTPEAKSNSLFDIRWDEIGSVLYDLWFILAATVAVIVLARPVGWLVNRIKRAQRTSTPEAVLR